MEAKLPLNLHASLRHDPVFNRQSASTAESSFDVDNQNQQGLLHAQQPEIREFRLAALSNATLVVAILRGCFMDSN
jgi:hypothetical protein